MAVASDFDLRATLDHLAAGGVIAAPTETFYGLLADATNPKAIDAVLALKPRDAGKGIGLLLPNRESWSSIVSEIPPLAATLADRFWPGPLTIALRSAPNLDTRLTLGGSIGVRLAPASPAATLAAAFGRPLTATSANPPGEPPAGQAGDVEAAFAAQIAQGSLLVLPGRSPGGLASTVVTVTGSTAKIVRPGAVSADALAAVVGSLI